MKSLQGYSKTKSGPGAQFRTIFGTLVRIRTKSGIPDLCGPSVFDWCWFLHYSLVVAIMLTSPGQNRPAALTMVGLTQMGTVLLHALVLTSDHSPPSSYTLRDFRREPVWILSMKSHLRVGVRGSVLIL